jgi:predicted MPP superfamily phosphohydrolase
LFRILLSTIAYNVMALAQFAKISLLTPNKPPLDQSITAAELTYMHHKNSQCNAKTISYDIFIGQSLRKSMVEISVE